MSPTPAASGATTSCPKEHRRRLLARDPRREGLVRHLPRGHRPRRDHWKRSRRPGSSTPARRAPRSPGSSRRSMAGQPTSRGTSRFACSRCHDMAKTGCPRCHKTDSGEAPMEGRLHRVPQGRGEVRVHPSRAQETASAATHWATSTSSPPRAKLRPARPATPRRSVSGSSTTPTAAPTAPDATRRLRSTTPASARSATTARETRGSSRTRRSRSTPGRASRARLAIPRRYATRTARATVATLRRTTEAREKLLLRTVNL